MASMTLEETLGQLEALGMKRMRAQNSRNGAGDNHSTSPSIANAPSSVRSSGARVSVLLVVGLGCG